MKQKTLSFLSAGFIILSAISLLSVSLMAMNDPQSVMDMVSVQLHNNDAFSSIRGVYGGVGLTLFIALLYTIRRYRVQGLGFLAIFWGLYAASRLLTIAKEGSLGAFGQQWLVIESVFCITAVVLFIICRKQRQVAVTA